MHQETSNPYVFQYLITGITGQGIEQVYLPPKPNDEDIYFRQENKWKRPIMPVQLKKWSKEWLAQKAVDKNYVHAQAEKIVEWQNWHWGLTRKGMWIWVNGVATYLTPFYVWYLTVWKTYFGFPVYRETDKELTYFIDYCCEDPDSYGGLINTIRRYGKSSIFAAWIAYRTMYAFNHTAGMQGQKLTKVKKFFNKMIVKPFLKMVHYMKPTFDTTSTHKEELRFDSLPDRAKNRQVEELDDSETFESVIDYRASGTDEYDGEVLDSYIIEEPGKIVESSIYSEEGDGIWDVVKPCLEVGDRIRGKAFAGTTVEFLNIADRGGRAYKELFYDSDFNQKQPNGRTKSGMYTCFIPGDCAFHGYLDEFGHPRRAEARAAILKTRESFKGRPTKLAGYIRRFPLSMIEIFYVNPEACSFDSEVLQEALQKIDQSAVSLTNQLDLYWENNIPFTKVLYRSNPKNGWLHINDWPDIGDSNKVHHLQVGDKVFHQPLNDEKFAIGFDPIQHRTPKGKKTSRESRPVAMIKRKYDSAIDGIMDDALMRQRREEKFPYQTNKYIAMMMTRPNDPNVLYERLLMICWFLGCSAHIESQKGAVINYFYEKDCGDFVMAKYTGFNEERSDNDGTASTPRIIEEYVNEYDHYITNYGHTMVFREQVEDALIFDPNDPTPHDHTVASGFCELACKMKPRVEKQTYRDISDFMPIRRNGKIVA